MTARVGVVLNPVAGFGGTRAMHGTDDLSAAQYDDAVAAGRARARLVRALRRAVADGDLPVFLGADGVLGADALREAGVPFQNVSVPRGARTTAADTRASVDALIAAGADCIVFAGGDGTATDIADVVGETVPLIGVPAGVKMHSEVFSRSPESAGRLLRDVAAGRATVRRVEILDVAPGAPDGPRPLHTVAAPVSRDPLQGPKAVAASGPGAHDRRGIARALLADASAETTWILGPGTTTAAVAEALGFTPTLRGVDVRLPDGSVVHDVTEQRLYDLVCSARRPRLVLGVVGGQGFLLGRGNQEISPRVVAAIGAEQVDIVATEDKVAGLHPPILFIDADPSPQRPGSGASSHPLLGYRRVRTGARDIRVLNVVDAAA
ncbi:NAD(+)/NADH kinase [Microbacterium sp. ET2]|uniref:ATP-NAD kinase family protein n=1 Tax=Microbacterium albipurpureum TaxID=3050384 RepID=UPI00259CCE38|nr:NAD(+)/NADH kinase [Microbacterium sp. ET2 (Ac-2212)]WJL96332.1 NAD(+)/NADH kinase [Microbacterium sp. ET2 (Ac-2212)]